MEKNLALEKLNLLVREEEVWLSSMDLAEYTDKKHFNVVRDIEQDMKNGVDMILRNLRTALKFEGSSQETLMEYLERVQSKLREIDDSNIYLDSILSIKVNELDALTGNGKIKYYLLNREASLMILSRYSPEVRIIVSNLFFKSLDLLKSKGYVINDVDDYYKATEEEFKMNVDMFADDLEEDGILSEFNAFYLLDILMRKIPKKMNDYFCNNFPLYKRIRRQVYEKGDTLYTVQNNVKANLGKKIK